MSTPAKLGAYLGALAFVLAASVGLGRAVGPLGDAPPAPHERPPTTTTAGPAGSRPGPTHAHPAGP